MHTHHHNSCGFCEEGLPEQHLCIDPPEQYHEDERLARWAAGAGSGMHLHRWLRPIGKPGATPQHDTPAFYWDICG